MPLVGLATGLAVEGLEAGSLIGSVLVGPVVVEAGALVGSGVGDAAHDEGNAGGSKNEVDAGGRIIGLSDLPKVSLVTGLVVGI